MKIEYTHRAGGRTHGGPSGIEYEFAEDALGRWVAEVTDPADIERFLSLQGWQGEALFLEVPELTAKPRRNAGRAVVADDTGMADGNA